MHGFIWIHPKNLPWYLLLVGFLCLIHEENPWVTIALLLLGAAGLWVRYLRKPAGKSR